MRASDLGAAARAAAKAARPADDGGVLGRISRFLTRNEGEAAAAARKPPEYRMELLDGSVTGPRDDMSDLRYEMQLLDDPPPQRAASARHPVSWDPDAAPLRDADIPLAGRRASHGIMVSGAGGGATPPAAPIRTGKANFPDDLDRRTSEALAEFDDAPRAPVVHDDLDRRTAAALAEFDEPAGPALHDDLDRRTAAALADFDDAPASGRPPAVHDELDRRAAEEMRDFAEPPAEARTAPADDLERRALAEARDLDDGAWNATIEDARRQALARRRAQGGSGRPAPSPSDQPLDLLPGEMPSQARLRRALQGPLDYQGPDQMPI